MAKVIKKRASRSSQHGKFDQLAIARLRQHLLHELTCLRSTLRYEKEFDGVQDVFELQVQTVLLQIADADISRRYLD